MISATWQIHLMLLSQRNEHHLTTGQTVVPMRLDAVEAILLVRRVAAAQLLRVLNPKDVAK
jgi:hypothetical protein